jgi:hypothetical protein
MIRDFINNSRSIMAGKRFAKLYADSSVPAHRVYAALEKYRALRRKLPVEDISGKRIGNHPFSRYLPWRATQGENVPSFASPFASKYR